MDILNNKLQHYFKAVHMLQQCCLPNISMIMNNRHINNTIDTYGDMYKYFRLQPATFNFKAVHMLQQCCLPNLSTIMNNKHISDTVDTYKDMYRYFRHQAAT